MFKGDKCRRHWWGGEGAGFEREAWTGHRDPDVIKGLFIPRESRCDCRWHNWRCYRR